VHGERRDAGISEKSIDVRSSPKSCNDSTQDAAMGVESHMIMTRPRDKGVRSENASFLLIICEEKKGVYRV